MCGAPVKRLQEKLGVVADGIFGAGTEAALRDFQKSSGMSVDGIAGPDTFTALGLNELVLLRLGIRGEAVKKLQSALGLDADGKFGPTTQNAVRDLQAAKGLDVDGIAGPETLAKLPTFSDFTEETVPKATVQPDEEKFESEPMPEIKGAECGADTAVSITEKQSVWSKVKGWLS